MHSAISCQVLLYVCILSKTSLKYSKNEAEEFETVTLHIAKYC